MRMECDERPLLHAGEAHALPRGALVDLDGTLIAGGAALPGAARLVAALGSRLVVVSNDAEHEPAEVSRLLARAGLAAPADRILLAGALAVDRIAAERPGASVLMLASQALMDRARRAGLVPVPPADAQACSLVFLGRDRAFSFERLAAAATALRAGAALVAANPDLTHPGPGGRIVPETGALLAALLACAGPVPHRVFGKPEPALFEAGLRLLGLQAAEAVMIGDNPATDGIGARRLGLAFIDVSQAPLPPPEAFAAMRAMAIARG